ncbi:choice-of-anchor tandem repeat GloVer-containing protein [Pseudochryseolinea flava]|uniref:Secretion system C-terminal sorting domain-containing protein n=1 Tax=Pseudochryseolinea flava TaxID=2059302 RepID=A0A364XXZ7_9BACT|nr:choice-of-anchor tandem repeat GloVer-containing protein [Pseudochryseolinea flava]RAV98869.1 hypothetical protein DQQ10_21440 [Pseudochryseolinea flava]
MKNLKPFRHVADKLYRGLKILGIALVLSSIVNTTIGQTIYTTLSRGGSDNMGAIGHFDELTSTWTKDFEFTTPYPGGAIQNNHLVEANGKFYGLSPIGGENNFGLLFSWDPITNEYNVLFEFGQNNLQGTNGFNPSGSMVHRDGKLYGAIATGGIYSGGVIFEFDLSTGVFTKRYDFEQISGRSPIGELQYHNLKFYGVTVDGGSNGNGVIFEWDPVSNIYNAKIEFTTARGLEAAGSMTLYNGKFYGQTTYGGPHDNGTLYEWDPLTNIFTVRAALAATTNGNSTRGPLILSNGKFYGIARSGSSDGILFEWDPSTFAFTKTLSMFCSNNNLCQPFGSLAAFNGKLYGFTAGVPDGKIFEWDPLSNTVQTKVNFNTKGAAFPAGKLVFKEGKFFAMTNSGGLGGWGVIFEWNPGTNSYKNKINFNTAPDGSTPLGDLIAVDGKFYGMTSSGGNNGSGVLFRWDPAINVFTKLFDFSVTQGRNPQGILVHRDGKLYGMTVAGGIHHDGVIFSYDLLTNVYSKKVDFDCGTTGCLPQGSLTWENGKFYATTQRGGATNGGTIFEWEPITNVFTKRYDFQRTTGYRPTSTLTFQNGKFYGTTNDGGPDPTFQAGGVFQWDPLTNNYTLLKSFTSAVATSAHGELTYVNGKFYGLASNGGLDGVGTIYSLDLSSNEFKAEYSFMFNASGIAPKGALTLSDGKLYGTAERDGPSAGGGYLFWYEPSQGIYKSLYNFTMSSGFNPSFTKPVVIPSPLPIPNVFITSPADGSVGQKIKLNLTSKKLTGASIYTIQVSPTSLFGEGTKTNSGGISQSFDSLAFNTTYYTRVKTDLSPAWGKITTFKTVGASFYSFVKTPSHQATNILLSQKIIANTVAGATSYTVELSEDSTFNPGTVMTRTQPYTIFDFGRLTPGTTYYSRVRTNLDEAWGELRSFTTQTALSATYVTQPIQGATNVNAEVVYVHANNIGAETYTFQLSTHADFSTIDFEQTTNYPSATFSDLSYNTKYYNRVKTDLTSAFGEIRHFTTRDASAYAYVESPMTGANNLAYVLDVKSNNVRGASLYTIELNTEIDFSGTSIVQSASTNKIQFELDYDQLYFVRVKTDLSTAWGKTTYFTTGNPVSRATIIDEEVYGWPTSTTVSVGLRANLIHNATLYGIEVSPNPDFSGPMISLDGPYRNKVFTLQTSMTYYARVWTDLAFGERGPVYQFYTQSPPPNQPIGRVTTPVEDELLYQEHNVSSFPNPFMNELVVNVHTSRMEDVAITMFDLTGREVHAAIISSNNDHVLHTNLLNGVYLLKVKTSSYVETIKVIREQK